MGGGIDGAREARLGFEEGVEGDGSVPNVPSSARARALPGIDMGTFKWGYSWRLLAKRKRTDLQRILVCL
jgi:hypothetical protein